ncbi:hypothetical protein PCANC_00363 [Puccinia coronata f. sp. avenae]|uniref:Uncharacterized protein n=1 Tax=Puccinia coronata f. sp. avenae TaxID=200324 RepID=A0A2N5W932_9BASI|nr:hypothetical protein PCANC_27657 [Puccinia coronata f. sp. avenae]PLW58744.1 hypothetical protein PCANC_00363 [Puccinia coronata f. sp. avenae]
MATYAGKHSKDYVRRYQQNHTQQPYSNLNNLPIVSKAPIKPKPPPLAPKDTFCTMGTNGLYCHHKQMLMDNSFQDSSRNSSFVVNSFNHHPSYPPKPIQHAQLNSNFISHATPSAPNLNRPSPLPTSSFNFAIGDAPRPGSAYDHPIPISSTPNLRHGFEHNQSTSACNHPPPMPAPSPLPFYPINTSHGPTLSRRTDANFKPNSQPANPATITPVTTAAQAAKLGNGRLLSRRETLDSGRLLKVGLRETKRAKSNSNMTDPDHPCTPILSSAPNHQRPPASSFPLPSAAASSSLPLPPPPRASEPTRSTLSIGSLTSSALLPPPSSLSPASTPNMPSTSLPCSLQISKGAGGCIV